MRQTLRTRGSMILVIAVIAALASIVCYPGSVEARNFPKAKDSTPPPPPPPPPPPEISTPPPIVTPPPPDNPPPDNPPPVNPPVNPPPPGTPPGGTQNLPEPATLVTGLIGSALAGLFAASRRKRLSLPASPATGSSN